MKDWMVRLKADSGETVEIWLIFEQKESGDRLAVFKF